MWLMVKANKATFRNRFSRDVKDERNKWPFDSIQKLGWSLRTYNKFDFS